MKTSNPRATLNRFLLAALILLPSFNLMATTYYSFGATGDPALTTSWWTANDGTGSNPADFVSSDTFEIQSGCNYTLTTAWAVTAGASTAILIDSGGTLTIADGTLTLTHGSALKDVDVNGALVFSGAGQISLDPGATVVVEAGTFPNGSLQAGYTGSDAFTGAGYTAGAVTINGTYQLLKANGTVSTCTWSTGSTLLISPTTTATGYPAAVASMSQSFYNVKFNLTNQLARVGNSGGLTGNLNVLGDLTFLNTYRTNPATGAGTITATTTTNVITGSGTTFNVAGNGIFGALTAGSIIYDGSGNFIGIVSATAVTATSITLLTNAAVNVSSGSFQYVNQSPLIVTLGASSAVTVGGNVYVKGTSWIGLWGLNGGTPAGTWTINGSLLADPNTLIEGSGFGNSSAGLDTVKFAGSGTITFPTNLYASAATRIYGRYGIDSYHAGSGGHRMAYQITGNYKLGTPWRLNYGGTTPVANTLTVTNNGTLDCGPYNIYSATNGTSGNNSFTLADGATLGIGSPAGITTNLANQSGTMTTLTSSKAVTGAGTAFDTELQVGSALYDGGGTLIGVVAYITNSTSLSLSGFAALAVTGGGFQSGQGNIQVLGTKIYSSAAKYIYNGTAAQATGNSLPATVSSLTLSNTTAAVALSTNVTATNLTVIAGATLDFNSQTVTTPNAPVLNGALTMEVTKTAPNTFTGSKLTQTAGTLTYGGALTIVTNASSVSPLAGGDVIDLFDAPAFGGSFSPATCPSLLAGQTLSTAGLIVDGSVAIAGGGPSGPGYITNSISGSTLTLSWPAGQGWRLQMQTNSLSTGLRTNWVDLSGSSISSTNITVNPANPTVFYRLIYP